MATAGQNLPEKAKVKITTQVLGELQGLQNRGRLDLPPNYSVANALNSAWLTLLETKDASKRPVLESCTQASIVNALRNMAYLGLNPAKKQAYFIAYGNQLSLFVSYFGNMAIAKRVDPNIEDIVADVIYQGDRVVTAKAKGRTYVSVHEHEFGNEDPATLIGAYCTIIYRDGTQRSTLMNMDQIRACWKRGQTKGNSSAHKDTPDQMAMRTVINRAVKPIINTSDDASILIQAVREVEADTAKIERDAMIEEKTGAQTLHPDALDLEPVVDIPAESAAAPVVQEPAAEVEPEPAGDDLAWLGVDPETGNVVDQQVTIPA